MIYSEQMFDWVRKMLGVIQHSSQVEEWGYPENIVGDVLSCFWCLSLVIAISAATSIAFLLKLSVLQWFLVAGASAGGAIYLERNIRRSTARL
jgi:hypothetical protein